MSAAFLTAEWRKLAMANYAVPPEILAPYLPCNTELDHWNGKCFVSLVGFMFINTKMKGIAIPFHRNFEEVNLRFYVRYKDGSEWKRGVCFISEIVPKPAITIVANTLYREKYRTMPMKHQWKNEEQFITAAYQWKYKNKWNNFSVTAEPVPNEMLPDSEEEFITEHYWGYSRYNEAITYEYGVEHPRWLTYKVTQFTIDVNFSELYGTTFGFLKDMQPYSVLLEGSAIKVLGKRKII